MRKKTFVLLTIMLFTAAFMGTVSMGAFAFAEETTPDPFAVSNFTKEYNGSATDIPYTLAEGITDEPDIVYYGDTYTLSDEPPIEVGEYTARLTMDAFVKEVSYTISLGTLVGIVFEDVYVVYDGNAHYITASGITDDMTVTYTANSGTEIGIYKATVTVERESYKTFTKTAGLYIMGTTLSYSEGDSVSAILSDTHGFSPAYSLISLDKTTDEDTVALFNGSLVSTAGSAERIVSIRKVYLMDGTVSADIEHIVTAKLLIPSGITKDWKMRILHLPSDGSVIEEVEYTVQDGYCVFNTSRLGTFAFITAEATTAGNTVVTIIVYILAGLAAIVVLAVLLNFMKGEGKARKKRIRDKTKYI